MIKTLEIENFKSIKYLTLNCRRINIFIGEPNTGKSNILETIGLLSHIYFSRYVHGLENYVRLEDMSDLFYQKVLENSIKIRFASKDESFKELGITFRNNQFLGTFERKEVFTYDYHAKGDLTHIDYFKKFKIYRFSIRKEFPEAERSYLIPPNAPNLFMLLMTNKELRMAAKTFLEKSGLKLVFRHPEMRIDIQTELEEDVIVSFPYHLLSDTLQRVIFHLAAIVSNRDSIIAFEEPEAHSFPYYTKYLAERIAFDENGNQYFISTHNPYFLLSLVEKAKKEDIAVFLTYFEDKRTKVKPLYGDELKEILEQGIDVFFNVENLIKGTVDKDVSS